MEYCDHLDKEGKFVNQHQEDRYIASGVGQEVFCNRFNYHGFRYIKITNMAMGPKKENIKACQIHTAYREAATFECSDNDLNAIHNMLFYTLRCLSLGGYLVDCPQLERLGYGGDGNASTLTAQTMFDLGPLYSNWLQAWSDCIREDGGMPHTAPNPYPAGGGPYWCGFIITASLKTYQNYGDLRVLEKFYPVMQQWLGYVGKYSPDGMLQPWPETDYRGWYLGDWATTEGVDQKDKRSVNLVNNCFVSQCLETMEKISNKLGKKDDAAKYVIQNEKLKKQIHQTFYNVDRNSYASGSQIDLTYPLLMQIVPESLKAKVTKTLTDEVLINRKGHMATGLVGIPIFTEWAVKYHASGLFYSLLKKRDYPGYLFMMDQGATTTWEHWSGDRSRIHNCYNGIGSWFYQAVGGIRPDDRYPGYQQVFIDPQIPEGVSWAKTTKETPYGTIGVNWSLEGNTLNTKIEIPVGCTAKVVIPNATRSYSLNGKTYRLKDHNRGFGVPIGSGKHTMSYIFQKDIAQ
jgi:alpha-L-rhamnosidase